MTFLDKQGLARLWNNILALVAVKADKQYVDQQITATEQSTDGKLSATLDEAKEYINNQVDQKTLVQIVRWEEGD